MTITIQQLRYLTLVSEHGSISAAATHPGVTQPVISRALATLQRELKVPLLRRRGKKLVLTSTGEAILRPACRLLSAADEVRHAASEGKRPSRLRTASGSSLIPLLISPLKGALENHRIDVQFVSGDTPDEVAELLVIGQADLGFGERPAARHGVCWIPQQTVEGMLVSAAGLDLPPSATMRDLERSLLLFPPEDIRRPRLLDQMFLQAGVRPSFAIKMPETISMLPLIRAGIGAMFGRRFVADDFPELEVRSFVPPFLIEVGFSYRIDCPPQVRSFIELMPDWWVSTRANGQLNRPRAPLGADEDQAPAIPVGNASRLRSDQPASSRKHEA